MIDPERPRRPGRVIVFVLALWIIGITLQTVFGTAVGATGLLEPDTSLRAGQILGWGLLCVVSFVYRHQIDDWLRS
jgi:hypothetical protein